VLCRDKWCSVTFTAVTRVRIPLGTPVNQWVTWDGRCCLGAVSAMCPPSVQQAVAPVGDVAGPSWLQESLVKSLGASGAGEASRPCAPSDIAPQEDSRDPTLSVVERRSHVRRLVRAELRKIRRRHQRKRVKASAVVVPALNLTALVRGIVSRAAAALSDPGKIAIRIVGQVLRGATADFYRRLSPRQD